MRAIEQNRQIAGRKDTAIHHRADSNEAPLSAVCLRVSSSDARPRNSFPRHSDFVRLSSTHTAEKERVCGVGVRVIRAVPVSSAARRRRNQEVIEIRRTAASATSARSKTINPKPPPCSSKSAALRAASAWPWQLIQSSCSRRRPASAADSGSKVPPASIQAQHSPRRTLARG